MSLGQETTATLQPQSEWVDQRRLVAALVATALLTVAFWRRRDLAAGLKIAWDAGKQRALALAAGATIGTRDRGGGRRGTQCLFDPGAGG